MADVQTIPEEEPAEQVPIPSLDHEKKTSVYDMKAHKSNRSNASNASEVLNKSNTSQVSIAPSRVTVLDEAKPDTGSRKRKRHIHRHRPDRRSKYANLGYDNKLVVKAVDKRFVPPANQDRSSKKLSNKKQELKSPRRNIGPAVQPKQITNVDPSKFQPPKPSPPTQIPQPITLATLLVQTPAAPSNAAVSDVQIPEEKHNQIASIVPPSYLPVEQERERERSPAPKPRSPATRKVKPRDLEALKSFKTVDKSLAKYSYKHYQMCICKANHAGRLTMFAFWLTFLLFTIVIDYMKFERTVVLKQETYDVVYSFDCGIISNLDAQKFGWIIALFIIFWIFLFFKETLYSRYPWLVITSSVLLVLIFTFIIIMSIIGQIWGLRFKTSYIIVMVYTIIWIFWVLHETYTISMQSLKMDDPTFPGSTIIGGYR